MKPIPIESLPPALQAQARAILLENREPGIAVQARPVVVKPTKADLKNEKELQTLCDAWLKINGYWPRQSAFLTGSRPEKGWYLHTVNAVGNPITLDYIIMRGEKFIEVELKVSAPISPEQAVIIEQGGKLARSVPELAEIVRTWEAS